MKGISCFFIAILAGLSASAHAYELATHGWLTYEAYKRSIFLRNQDNSKDSLLAKRLGVDLENTNVFGITYFDVLGSEVRERTANSFESKGKRMPDGVDPLSLPGWLMRGAIREDDTALFGDNPQDDPYGNIIRVVNHFYDPVNNRGLVIGNVGLPVGEAAPNWALGTTDAFMIPMATNPNRRNHFSILDAREAMWRALTLKAKQPDGSYSDISPFGSLTTIRAVRNAYWATTFRALGDVLHLNQDMAQPQHTRNDPAHLDHCLHRQLVTAVSSRNTSKLAPSANCSSKLTVQQ